MFASQAIDASLVSSKFSVPALSVPAILMPLVPAVIAPRSVNVVTGVLVALLMVVPAVVLRRRRWATRMGAALLFLLAVAAAVPPITGLGWPSEEEMERHLTVQYFVGNPAEFDGVLDGPSGFLPWDANDLVLFAAVCLAAAGLLLALGRVVHQDAREMLPLRWRWPLVMWGAALTLVSSLQVMVLGAVAGGTTETGMVVMDGGCFGAAEQVLFWPTAMVMLIPPPIVVTVGFALWALLAGTGHRPLGRVVGWLTVLPLVLSDLVVNWLPAIGCARSTDEMSNPVTLAWVLYTFLPVVLIVVAVRVRRVPSQRSRRWNTVELPGTPPS